MPSPTRQVRTLGRVLLGLFVFGQILFLLLANALSVVHHAQADGSLGNTGRMLTNVTERWSQLTSQPQNWSLFAPEVDTECAFVAVELTWDDAEQHRRVLLLSENEPEDLRSYARWGRFRQRRLEASLTTQLWLPEGKELDDVAVVWQQDITDRVRSKHDAMRAYLQSRLASYHGEHPDVPGPREVRLLVRTYRIPAPGDLLTTWPMQQWPLARWRPGTQDDRFLPVEAFDPVMRSYQRLKLPAVRG